MAAKIKTPKKPARAAKAARPKPAKSVKSKSSKSVKSKPATSAKLKSDKPAAARARLKSKVSNKLVSKPVKKTAKPAAAPKKSPAPKSATLDLTGKKAPAFTLGDQHGDPVSLASLTARGPVVLYFYPKDMTPGCTVEACSFRDNLNAVQALGAQVVGVSADSTASHQKFVAKQSLNFPLLSDPAHAVTTAYGVYKKKSLYGREFMGIERTTFIIGADGLIKRIFPKVKVNGHTAEVLAALEQLA
jgi:peroxiredoxin